MTPGHSYSLGGRPPPPSCLTLEAAGARARAGAGEEDKGWPKAAVLRCVGGPGSSGGEVEG